MTIDKAIKILSDSAQSSTTHNEEFRDALKLGIEALKRIINSHEDDALLPWETKE